jgi:hypothetical protein
VARRVLELAASKDAAVFEAARALAAIVLAGDEVRLARQALEGGPLAFAAPDVASWRGCFIVATPNKLRIIAASG